MAGKKKARGLAVNTARWGVLFLLPWMVGAFVFFLIPLCSSLWYSFNQVSLSEDGLVMRFTGLSNFTRAFRTDPMFVRLLLTMFMESLPKVVIVVIFSLLAAVLLNGKYPLRNVARTVFFIPIIMGTSIATAHIIGTDSVSMEISGATTSAAFGAEFFIEILNETGLPTEIVGYVSSAVTGIFSVLAISGVPTLIFLAGLQSIQPSLYEVAKIEGATQYETFWKVTLPMISPMIVLCAVYSIIDAFTRHYTYIEGTKVVFLERLHEVAFRQNLFGLSASMSALYMFANVLVIVPVSYLMSRTVFYYD
ncbi:MAG: sugar ABC transporter permease [Clostridiales bacterium]|jgi:ABC-type sugar transport system permease subunit|nr:sugar ABC transporter permease [Clostridiales bacterium]